MNIEEITSVVERLARFLADYRFEEQSKWMLEQAQELSSPHLSDRELRATLDRLRGCLTGMGGLVDFYPRDESGNPSLQAEKELIALADQLFSLISTGVRSGPEPADVNLENFSREIPEA